MTTIYRAFGIELECVHRTELNHITRTRVANAIQAMGFPSIIANYSSTNYGLWQIKTDGSVAPQGRAIEVVSRTFPRHPTPQALLTESEHSTALDEVRKVANWLSNNQFDVNVTCGFHIHINTSDLTQQERHAVALRYELRQDMIRKMLPPSRYNGVNHYTKFLEPRSASMGKIKAAVRDPRAAAYTSWSHSERYVACNLEHSNRIEFRQAAGTLNAPKIIGWYHWLCEFIAETVKMVREYNAAPAAIAPVTPAPVAVTVAQQQPRVPHIDPTTDAAFFIGTLVRKGWIDDGDRPPSWPDTRLRVTAHALRRMGANIETVRGRGIPTYAVAGNEACADRTYTLEQIFTLPVTVRSRIETPAQQSPAQAPSRPRSRTLEEALQRADFFAGVSPETRAWVEQRMAVFSEDVL